MSRTASIPRATYRVQLNRDFRFSDAAGIVPYLARLGVSHLYTSPILKARPGSAHGYDVIDHTVLNPDLGTQGEFDHLIETLHAHGMGLIVDIVPNHLGIMGCDNVWWLDVLENGPAALSASNFDIDWRPNRASLRNRVLVPILGDSYGDVLERGELRVVFAAEHGSFLVRYYEHCFPIDPREYPKLFEGMFAADDADLPPDHPDRADFESLLTAFANLPPRDDDESTEAQTVRYRDKEAHKRRLARLVERSPEIRARIDAAIERINGVVGEPQSFDALDRLLESQAFRLAYWRVAIEEINYRRFFDVNDLAALRMNEPAVFDQTHRFIFSMVDAGKIDGLRIDHSDGLFDPLQYFEQLQQRFGASAGEKPLYVVTEKILAAHERLPSEWPVYGTTGYDFTALATGWLVYADHERAITRTYRQFTGIGESFDEIAYQSKKLVMRTTLAAEVEVLANQLDRIAQLDRHTADFTRGAMREAIVETVARFPVYRTYVSGRGVSDEDRRIVQWAVNVARSNAARSTEQTIYTFLRDVLLGDAAAGRPASHARAMLEFAMKFQQVTAPVTAKGIEDTALYRYNRLICVNEVGGDPRRLAFSNAAVHQESLERARAWPHSMLATSTHDTKRSEDVRARIAVLSELPELWKRHLSRWNRLNRSKRRQLESGAAPSRNDEYLIYQTLLGIWSPQEPGESLLGRLQAYLIKAAREAKRVTSWMNPNEEYEAAVTGFAARLLENPEQNAFLRDFTAFAGIVAYFGHLNSLAQTVLKLTSPGVPDLYQGTEAITLALVDPDNRRPVDYAAAERMLHELAKDGLGAEERRATSNEDEHDSRPESRAPSRLECALQSPHSSTAKVFLTWRLLELRRQYASVFERGDYEPLASSGKYKDHVLAFARNDGERCVVVLLAKWMAHLMSGTPGLPLGRAWADTVVAAPRSGNTSMYDWITGYHATSREGSFEVAELLSSMPLAVLVSPLPDSR